MPSNACDISQFVTDALEASCNRLGTANLSERDRRLVGNKMPLIEEQLCGGRNLLVDILMDVDSRPLRSKLLAIVLCVRHEAIMQGFAEIEQSQFGGSSTPYLTVTVACFKDLVDRANELISDLRSRSSLEIN